MASSASRKRVVGAIVLVAVLAACSDGGYRPTRGTVFNQQEISLEEFTALTMQHFISVRSSVFTHIQTSPNVR
jgi:hypothetical protein